MTDVAIRTEKLTRHFGNLVAVDGMDLQVTAGQFFGFLGPNGAGKSTTIKMLTGLLAPSSGRVEVLGIDFRFCELGPDGSLDLSVRNLLYNPRCARRFGHRFGHRVGRRCRLTQPR